MFVVAAAVLACAAASANAQTIGIAMAGSSALFNELGQFDGSVNGCLWFDGSKTFTATDSRPASLVPAQPNLTDTGNAWVSWNANGGTCAAPTNGPGLVVDFDLSTDSTVGNRCFFANPACKITTTVVGGTASAGTLGNSTIPTAVINLINAGGGTSINSAATDIRPEDASFATIRALAPCGQPVTGGSQYLGLGYVSPTATTPPNVLGVAIAGSASAGAGGGSFNVAAFNITGTDPMTGNAVRGFTVVPVGAQPIVVVVNPSQAAGFGSLLVSNIDRAVLSGYLDGTLGRVTDLVPQLATGGAAQSFVYVREALSGTFNTMEYSIPNSQSNQSSQDVGLAALNQFGIAPTKGPLLNCQTSAGSGVRGTTANAVVLQNPLQEQNLHGSLTVGGRFRSIGTGNLYTAVRNQTANGMGYLFWSAPNFGSATASNTKYLTVDGVDPIQEIWSDGLVPTTSNNQLGNVTMSHVKDGSYPIWSLLRTICDPAVSCTAVNTLSAGALEFLSPFAPDFVPVSQLAVFHSHFAPPTVNFPSSGSNVPSNGHGSAAEAGGDVGGLVYTVQADGSYIVDNVGQQGGIVGRRQ
jgi:hypothetical protein